MSQKSSLPQAAKSVSQVLMSDTPRATVFVEARSCIEATRRDRGSVRTGPMTMTALMAGSINGDVLVRCCLKP
jgi:hypothetical protein